MMINQGNVKKITFNQPLWGSPVLHIQPGCNQYTDSIHWIGDNIIMQVVRVQFRIHMIEIWNLLKISIDHQWYHTREFQPSP